MKCSTLLVNKLRVALVAGDASSAAGPPDGSAEAALRSFVRRQLRPLAASDELSQYLRIFNWEAVRPSPTFQRFMAEEAAPYLGGIAALVARFLPSPVRERQSALGALWLLGQCSIFVRNAEQLARPPLSFKVDHRFVDELADTIATWAAAGLRAG